MNINDLGSESNGSRNIEIRCNELSFGALLRCLRSIPGTVVTNTSYDPMNDNAQADIHYKGLALNLDMPFSDHIINGPAGDVFEEFVAKLRDHKVRWWEKI